MKQPLAQAGFSLPVAIFVLVVLSLLGAAMTRMLATGAQSVGFEVLSTRAFYAAESGAQWGMNTIFPPRGSAATTCFARQDLSFSGQGLTGCSAQVTCAGPVVVANAGGATSTQFRISSRGTCGSGRDTATRVIEVGAQNP